jgi:hypothetical protein
MKKDDAFKAVKQLQVMSLGADAEKILAQLYTFFLPKSPPKKTPKAWVALAIGGKHSDERLRHLYSNGKALMATDGHRLHIAPTTLPAGFYNAALDPVALDAVFPDVARVIPDPATLQAFVWDRGAPEEHTKSVPWVYTLPCGNVVNASYWDQATNGRDQVTYYAGSPGKDPLRIDHNGTLAVVMPLSGKG